MKTSRHARQADLESERASALRSLEDLEREHAAGDVDGEDYERLRSRYVERAAGVLRALEVAEATGNVERVSGEPGWRRLRRGLGRRKVRRGLGVVAVISIVAALGLVATELAGVRLPGEDATGSVNVPLVTEVAEQLAAASSAANNGQLSLAVQTYDAVLAEEPNQPEALTYKGWLVRLSGLQDHDTRVIRLGDGSLARAALIAPRYPDGRALDGVALLQDRSELSQAITEFRAFLADRPPRTLLSGAGAEIAAAFVQARLTVPAALRAYATPTTTS